MMNQIPDTSNSAQPLLLNSLCSSFEEGLDNDGVVMPPDPFAASHDDEKDSTNAKYRRDDDNSGTDDEDDDNCVAMTPCIEKLGLIIGIVMGVIVQLSTLAGSFVNVSVWEEEDGTYATVIFFLWCCIMCSMFFWVFGLLRFLVEMSLQMVYNGSQVQGDSNYSNYNNQQTIVVVEIPSDNPMPSPSTFPTIGINSNNNNTISSPPHEEVLEKVIWHIKLHYVLGISIGISLSWIATNLALGNERVSLMFSLVPPLLGWSWSHWMRDQQNDRKQDGTSSRQYPNTQGNDCQALQI